MTESSWLDSMTEAQAMDLVVYLERKFDWAIPSIWTRADIDSICAEIYGHDLSDEQWNAVIGSWEWRKGLSASTEDQAMLIFDIVRNAVSNASKGNVS